MCVNPFKTPKAPEAPAPVPPPAPAPMPSQEEVAPVSAEANRVARLKRLRYGLASTIKTAPTGISLYDFSKKLGA